MPTSLPSGTVTFMFSDIEGSTRLLQAVGAAYPALLEQHRNLIRAAAEPRGGVGFGSEGDALFFAFPAATGAIAAAVDAQRALAAHDWPPERAIRVRMGVHTGDITVVGDNYVGLDLHRVARIMSAGHGGQVLVSESTIALAGNTLPPGVSLRDMGERRLKDLSRPEHLYQLVIDGLGADFPPLRTLDATPNNLPTQVTTFIGRDREANEIRAALATTRLLTLTGPGGTGKTRLSLKVAGDVADDFADGAWFVPLDAITEPTLVASAIGNALGVQDTGPGSALDHLIAHLADRKTLIVLDNFEQVLAAAAVVADILRGSPGTRLIVTSRAPLRISGEREYPVPPLGLPDVARDGMNLEALTRYESVALFIERAVAVRPDFRLTHQNAAAVSAITAQLDGLPLAIELAAARTRMLPPEAILSRLGSRLGLLAGGARDLPERQQTLRGAIAWSYDLLDEPSRRLLARASIFVGGFGFDQAEAVCGPAEDLGQDVFEGLSALVDQSLIRQVETSGEPRFTMLQTIREFALEQLDASGERWAIARRHAETFLAYVEAAAPHFRTKDQRECLDALEREHDNLRAAIAWATEAGDVEMAVRFATVLWRFWQLRGYLREAAERLDRVLNMPGLAPLSVERGKALEAGAGIAYWMADIRRAEVLYAESLAGARHRGDPREIAEALYNLSFAYSVDKGDLPRALNIANEALAIYRDLDDKPWIARTLWALGVALFYLEDLEGARPLLIESTATFRLVGDQFALGWTLHTLGGVDLRAGGVDAATRAWTEMLRIFADADDITGIATGVSNFASLAVARGDALRALRLRAASSNLVQRTGTDLTNLIQEMTAMPAGLAEPVDTAAAERAWAEGRAMTTPDAIAYALEKGAPRSATLTEEWPVDEAVGIPTAARAMPSSQSSPASTSAPSPSSLSPAAETERAG